MSWSKIDENAYIGDGVIDKGTICMDTIVRDCNIRGIVRPTLGTFINALHHAFFVTCGKEHLDFKTENPEKLKVKAGFLDDPDVYSTHIVPAHYLFLEDILCKALLEIEHEYTSQFQRKPTLQEAFAIFSFVVCAQPESYLSDVQDTHLLYINAEA